MKIRTHSEIAGEKSFIMDAEDSGFLPNGRLYISGFATTSPIVAANAAEDSIVFTTKSGSTYTVILKGSDDLNSYFSATLLSMIQDKNPAFIGLDESDLIEKIRNACA